MRNNNSWKLFMVPALMLALTLLVSGAAYGADYTKVIDAAPFIEQGRTFDIVRPIAETFGVYVDWDQAEQQVTLTRNACKVTMKVGSPEITTVSQSGVSTRAMDVVPVLREGRVFLPVSYWAEPLGLSVAWQESDNSVIVSEGGKALTIIPGDREISLTGGHFLKAYLEDESFRFYHPESGVLGLTWEGYAEILMIFDDNEYVITAVNAGAGLSDPVTHTNEEIAAQISRNAERNKINVVNLPEYFFGGPAFRVDGIVMGVPQAGLVFLREGHICGLTVELKRVPSAMVGTLFNDQPDGMEILIDEPGEADAAPEAAAPSELDVSKLAAELSVVNVILDEIIASFIVF